MKYWCHTGDSQHTQNNPNQVLKVICTSSICSLLWYLGSTQIKWQGWWEDLLNYVFAHDSLTKIFCFKNKLWRVMKNGYCIIMWNRRDPRASEMKHHQTHQRLVFMQRRWYCVDNGDGRNSSYEFFLEKQIIHSNKYCI